MQLTANSRRRLIFLTGNDMKNFKFPTLNNKRDQGFALFLSVVITGTLLVIATSMVSLAYKQSLISTSGRESQHAFYAADSGLECALYWDVKNPSGTSAFDVTTGTSINCNRDGSNSSNQWVVGGSSQSTFTMTFLPDPYCAVVTVTKSGNDTQIDSKGYNSCGSANPRRVERAVRASY